MLKVQEADDRLGTGEVGVLVVLRVGMSTLGPQFGFCGLGLVGAPSALPLGRRHGDFAEGLSRHIVYTIFA